MEDLRTRLRLSAAADVMREFREENNGLVSEKLARLPDSKLEMMARISGITEEHTDIFVKQIRGEENSFTRKLNSFQNELKTGDIILVTGCSASSRRLVKAQKTIYPQARSSHVVVVHADFICIDAMPKDGVTCRTIIDVLSSVEEDWRVIRYKELDEKEEERILKSCTYYLNQPYKIFPSKKPAKKFSYCSELARKVFVESGVEKTGIPRGSIIKPCDFDRLADSNSNWLDVTKSVLPYIEFCEEYHDILRMLSHSFTTGLELNRKRYAQRAEAKRSIKRAVKKGLVSQEKGKEMLQVIRGVEANMNNRFWDYC